MNLLLKLIRIILSYVFLVAGIYTALSWDASHYKRAIIISVVWLGLATIDEIVFWKLIRSVGGKRKKRC